MALALEGRTALVSGGARGIGAAIVRKLAAAGSDVALLYYSSHAAAEALRDEVRAGGRRALALQADVADPDNVAAAVRRAADELGGVDLLINNAASGVLRPAASLTRKHWRWCMETNALALHSLVVGLGDRLRAGGRVVALSSLGAGRALPDYAFVGASKAALEALVRSLAVELGARRITVNAVRAGAVDTDALRAFPSRDALLAEAARRAALPGALTPDDVAAAVYLLCLPEASMITGQILVVDAGYSIAS